jgi:hypothetical protein
MVLGLETGHGNRDTGKRILVVAMTKPQQRRGTAGRVRVRKQVRADYDSPWKEALDRYFDSCLAFFFPQAHAEIDWSRGYEMLDKELQRIAGQAKQGRRTVDKLVKVWLKNGEERWLLIHVEVQTWKESDFPKRMYVYNYRIFDRYDREVISLAILADDDPAWRPSRYGYGRWGFHAGVEFPIVKLVDYAPRWPALEADPNPFALVVLAHLKTLETRHSPAERQAWKVRLVKSLYDRGMEPEEVRQLFRFIDWVMELPEARDRLFWHEITTYQQEKAMPFVTIAERIGMEKGLAEGREKGLTEGREKGLAEGREKGLLEGIEACLKLKFGAEGLELMPDLRELHDHERLRAVLDAIPAAASPGELRRVWTRTRRPKKGTRS